MAEEPKQPDLSQKIEVESQLQQSAEHALAEAEKAKILIAEALPQLPAEGISASIQMPSVPAAGQPPLAAAGPTLTGFGPHEAKFLPSGFIFAKTVPCPQCGATGPWKSERSLAMHIRAKHLRWGQSNLLSGNAAREAAVTKAKGVERETTPPDFSDLGPDSFKAAAPPLNGEPVKAIINFEAPATMTFDMSVGILARLFGPEWNPANAEERKQMIEGIRLYYQSINLPDIPPGYMLVILVAAYSAPRLAQPQTKDKLSRTWLWFKSKFSRRKPMHPIVVVKDET